MKICQDAKKGTDPFTRESPQHASECHLDSAVPGYVDYGIYHGATLKVNIEQGRFVFFYLPVEMPE